MAKAAGLLMGLTLFVGAGFLGATSVSAQTSQINTGSTTTEQPKLAQADQPKGTEEIVVTARRKNERLQDVPVSVTAFSAEQLEQHAIIDQITLADFTPGFQFSDYTNGRSDRGVFRALVFRGLWFPSTSSVTTPAMVFLDGAPVAFGDMLITDSIERVEVLKGPQNVNFGRSTFTGAVNYVTRNPGDVYSGSLTAEYGNYSDLKFDAHLEGPVVPGKINASVDAQLADKGGDWTDAADPSYKFGSQHTKSVAATIFATPTPDLSIKLYGTYFMFNDGLGATVIPNSGAFLNCNPNGINGKNSYFCGTVGKINPAWIGTTVHYSALENLQLHDPIGNDPVEPSNYCEHFGTCSNNLGLSSTIDYNLPWYGIKFQTITAYHVKDVSDLDSAVNQVVTTKNPAYGTAGNPFAPVYAPTADYNIMNRVTDFSTEERFSSSDTQRLRWTAGVNYVRTKDVQGLFFYEDPSGYIPPEPPGENYQVVSATTYGIYGGLYYDPLPGLTISAELRYQADDRIDTVQANGEILRKTFFSWAPRFAIEYKVDNNLNVYTSYSAGVRAGGFNSSVDGLPQYLLVQIARQVGTAPQSYKQEDLWTQEVGLKGSFFDRRISTNISGYYGRLTNEQDVETAILPTPDPIYGGRFDLTNNIGVVDIHGIEADAHLRVNHVLSFSGTGAWNYTQVRESYCQACALITGSTSINGNRTSNAPEYTFTFSAELEDRLTSTLDWFANVDFAYKGSMYLDENGLNLAETGAAKKVNAQAGIETANYTVSVWGTNLTNDETVTGGAAGYDFVSGAANNVRLGLPDKRAFGVRLKYKF